MEEIKGDVEKKSSERKGKGGEDGNGSIADRRLLGEGERK
jgi:hypothetical protein